MIANLRNNSGNFLSNKILKHLLSSIIGGVVTTTLKLPTAELVSSDCPSVRVIHTCTDGDSPSVTEYNDDVNPIWATV